MRSKLDVTEDGAPASSGVVRSGSFSRGAGGAGAQMKGLTILNAREYSVERWGEAGWAAVLERLTAADREALASMISAGWYEAGLGVRVLRAFVEAHGFVSNAHELGRWSAERDLTTIHRMFLKMANPTYVLEKSADLWRRYNNTGAWRVESLSSTDVRATLAGWAVQDEWSCVRLTGHLERLFELVGAKDPVITHVRCTSRNDEACVFEAHWH